MMAIGSWFLQLWRSELLVHERQERKILRMAGIYKANDPSYPGRIMERAVFIVLWAGQTVP
jgi:hypothetical protein